MPSVSLKVLAQNKTNIFVTHLYLPKSVIKHAAYVFKNKGVVNSCNCYENALYEALPQITCREFLLKICFNFDIHSAEILSTEIEMHIVS